MYISNVPFEREPYAKNSRSAKGSCVDAARSLVRLVACKQQNWNRFESPPSSQPYMCFVCVYRKYVVVTLVPGDCRIDIKKKVIVACFFEYLPLYRTQMVARCRIIVVNVVPVALHASLSIPVIVISLVGPYSRRL